MMDQKKESLYETLFKISQGDVELFKEETEDFLTVIEQYTGAAVKMQKSITADESKQTMTEVPAP